MTAIEFHMDGALSRAARHLIRVSAKTIARHADVDAGDLKVFEKGGDVLSPDEIRRVADALTHYGAHFIGEDSAGGGGVRRRHKHSTVMRIENWESEGGPVGDDDA